MTADQPPPEPNDDAPSGSFPVDPTSRGSVPADVVPATEPGSAVGLVDPLTAEVARALEQPPPQRTWMQSLVLLAISLVLFAAAGFFQNTVTDLALLVAILLFHESGHYLGMRLFNYQDVRMFFIPFFGAAVSGRTTSVEGYKEAIVLLLGPLPGIVLGIVLGIVCLYYDSPILRSATWMLLGLNGFNLLPLLPLDGGRLLHLIVFSRQRHIEALFRIVTAVLLALLAWAIGAWPLAIPAVFMLMGIRLNFQISQLAQQLRGPREAGKVMDLSERIPPEQAVPLIERVRAAFPAIVHAPTLASLVRQVWERMHLEPPGVLASILLLAIYGLSFFGTPIVAVLLQSKIPSETNSTRADGSPVQREKVRSLGRLIEFTELNAAGLPHGRHVEFYPLSDKPRVEGTFENGQRHGIWTYLREDGEVERQEVYRHGRPVGDVISPAK
jgi:Zn-dependent protease